MGFLGRLFRKQPPDGPAEAVSLAATRLHEVITAMCADPGRSFRKEAHAELLYALLPTSTIPKDVAELFAEATTFTAAFTGVRTTESMDALKKLCTIKGPVVDNLLHRIVKMSDSEQTQEFVNVDATGTSRSRSRTMKVSFQPQRDMARAELAGRGSPKYDARHYADK